MRGGRTAIGRSWSVGTLTRRPPACTQGSIEVDWAAEPPRVTLALRDVHGNPRVQRVVSLDELQFPAGAGADGGGAPCEVTDVFAHEWQQRWADANKIGFLVCLLFDFVLIFGALWLVGRGVVRLLAAAWARARARRSRPGEKTD